MTNEQRDGLLVRLETIMTAMHEERIPMRVSRLERWRSFITGGLAIVSLGVGWIVLAIIEHPGIFKR